MPLTFISSTPLPLRRPSPRTTSRTPRPKACASSTPTPPSPSEEDARALLERSLAAELNRRPGHDSNTACVWCHGSGERKCSWCKGNGFRNEVSQMTWQELGEEVERLQNDSTSSTSMPEPRMVPVQCSACRGRRVMRCAYCKGKGCGSYGFSH